MSSRQCVNADDPRTATLRALQLALSPHALCFRLFWIYSIALTPFRSRGEWQNASPDDQVALFENMSTYLYHVADLLMRVSLGDGATTVA